MLHSYRLPVKRYLSDRSGNFGVMTAILLPVLLGVAGMAIDVTRAIQIKSEMQGYADSSVLAAATQLAKNNYSHAAAIKLSKDYYNAHISAHDFGCTNQTAASAPNTDPTTSISQSPIGKSGKQFVVDLKVTHTMCVNPLTSLITGRAINLSVVASTVSSTDTRNAFSMKLVLDHSVSMGQNVCENRAGYGQCLQSGNVRRIDALKQAVNEFLDIIKEADPDEEYARLGRASYTHKMTGYKELAWKLKDARDFVQALRPGGTTESSEAMAHAFQRVSSSNEDREHLLKGNNKITKYIVWMSDGNNNKEISDFDTLRTCDAAKNSKVIVYSIAFDVDGKRADDLLKACAHTANHYYEAKTASQLYAAFRDIAMRTNAGTARITR